MASPNGLNPNFDRLSFKNGPIISGGSATGNDAIMVDLGGTPSALGAMYYSSNGSGEVWAYSKNNNTQGVFLKVTIP